jgi:hypothetical protein
METAFAPTGRRSQFNLNATPAAIACSIWQAEVFVRRRKSLFATLARVLYGSKT